MISKFNIQFTQLKAFIRSRLASRKAFSRPSVPPILIYQMGKVGSSTVYYSLLKAGLPNSILFLHRMTDIPARMAYCKKAGITPLPYHFYLGEAVSHAIQKNKDFPVRIITAVRDPIAIVISGIFHNPKFHGSTIKDDNGNLDAHKIVNYLEQELWKESTFDYVYDWLDSELKAVFDIDVFASPFPKEDGYARYSKGNTEVLLIRLEDLNMKGAEIITSFLELKTPLCLENANVASEKADGDKYKEVMKNMRLSNDLCNKIYSSRFVRHFYGEAMINKFISRWTKNNSSQ